MQLLLHVENRFPNDQTRWSNAGCLLHNAMWWVLIRCQLSSTYCMVHGHDGKHGTWYMGSPRDPNHPPFYQDNTCLGFIKTDSEQTLERRKIKLTTLLELLRGTRRVGSPWHCKCADSSDQEVVAQEGSGTFLRWNTGQRKPLPLYPPPCRRAQGACYDPSQAFGFGFFGFLSGGRVGGGRNAKICSAWLFWCIFCCWVWQ